VSPGQAAQTRDEPDYVALAASAEATAKSAESLHQAALWRELAETFRELAGYRRRSERVLSDQGT
jgi:hypothetical protein